jgi:excinuclease ABC subunit C
MIGPADELIYVGKSVRLRARLLSYFCADRAHKAARILAHTHRIEWDYAPSEFAALLAEMRAIQYARPMFNVEHKRDRAYCFVKITREEAPRLVVAREVRDDDAPYFGPFRGVPRVRELVRDVADLLELRDCGRRVRLRFADQLDLFAQMLPSTGAGVEPQPLCMRADVHKCLAPCAGRCTRAEYHAQVELARRFLDGDADVPLTILRQRMDAAAERLHFEYAASLRDRMQRLDEARADLVRLRGFIDSLSFVYEVPGHDGDDRVYIVQRGSIREEQAAPRTAADREALLERARTLLRKRTSSGRVVVTQAAEILLLARWFRLRPDELNRTWRPDTSIRTAPEHAWARPGSAHS